MFKTYGKTANFDRVLFSFPNWNTKYVRVYFQSMWDGEEGQRHSRYFVRVADGAIFACAGWKAPNFKRSFGTLDTIDQFAWGSYEGKALPGSSFTMKVTSGTYSTAIPK